MQTSPQTAPHLAALLESAPEGHPSADRLAAILEIEQSLRTSLETELERLIAEVPGRARDAARHLVDAGGKRIRPLAALVAAGVAGQGPEKGLPVAVAVELLHTGSLLHDDVVDEGDLRRGRPTARKVFGNPVSVLAGDFCILAALEAVMRLHDGPLLERTMQVARELTEAELWQLERRTRPAIPTREVCLSILDRKTASLFALATYGGARSAWASDEVTGRLERFGRRVGLAFQLVDDLLDVSGDPDRAGKRLGADLAQGTVTLPLIEAADEDPHLRSRLDAVLGLVAGGAPADRLEAEVHEVLGQVRRTGALERSRALADRLTREALVELEPLPEGAHRQVLDGLARALLDRVS